MAWSGSLQEITSVYISDFTVTFDLSSCFTHTCTTVQQPRQNKIKIFQAFLPIVPTLSFQEPALRRPEDIMVIDLKKG